MSTILIKIFATALAFSQVTTAPDSIKTAFDPERDRGEVTQLLRAGCAHMRKVFDIEDINVDELIAIAMEDKDAFGGEIKAVRGLNVADLHAGYRQFCKNESVEPSPIDIGQVVAFYNEAVKDLPDPATLKNKRLPGMSVILDNKGDRFAEVFTPDNRRVWTPIVKIPASVRNAFVAAEDKRFFQHTGIDERGLVRAFIGNMAQPGRPQGGSTITQQVAKNLLVGNDVTYERKLREIIVAARMERALSKEEILELYLNSIYLGRGSWGVEMAARSYFGKSVGELSVAQAALLAGLAKGPNYFSPERHPERARERLSYVLGRMQEDGAIAASAVATKEIPQLVAYERSRRDFGFHFVDYVAREAKSIAGIEGLTESSYAVRSTINTDLQIAVEAAVQEGLARYELNTGRYKFQGAEANLADAVRTLSSRSDSAIGTGDADPAWLTALRAARLPLYDVHWEPAIIVEIASGKKGGAIKVGLADGRVLPLNAWKVTTRSRFALYDVVYVSVREAKGKQAARADLRVRPQVQGAALVIENKSGRILAMAGGFSYPLSQLNRVSQSLRQPGSTLKPLTYLVALRSGLQPNTLIMDEPLTLPPVGATVTARERDFWSPRNFDGGSSGPITLRRALENSRNLATAQLMASGIDASAEQGLDRVCELAMEAQLYKQCERFYPFVLGAQPLRLIDLAAFYSAIASEGARPTPHVIEAVTQDGREVYRHPENAVSWIGSADRGSFFQLKSMLQGVLERGTARAVRQLAPYVGGKTGTTDDELDAWFVGFTNDVTVAVWAGYDNGDGKRRTLGRGQTGAKVALPIFALIVQATWTMHADKSPLAPPSTEAMRQLVRVSVDPYSGDVASGPSSHTVVEYLKRNSSGDHDDTQFRIVSRGESYGFRGGNYDGAYQRWTYDNGPNDDRSYERFYDNRFYQNRSIFGPPRPYAPRYPAWRGPSDEEVGAPRAPRRVDPEYFFRRFY